MKAGKINTFSRFFYAHLLVNMTSVLYLYIIVESSGDFLTRPFGTGPKLKKPG